MGFTCFNLNCVRSSVSINICLNIYVWSTYRHKVRSSNKSLSELNLCICWCKSINRQGYNYYCITNSINLVWRLACSSDRSCNNDAKVYCELHTAVRKSTHWVCCNKGKQIWARLSFICCSKNDFCACCWILINPRWERATVCQCVRQRSISASSWKRVISRQR